MFGWPVERIETEKRRLSVLTYLARAPGYEANQVILLLYCRERGVPTTADQMDACLAWLREPGLITARDEGDVLVARITGRGREVALGQVRHPGVLTPDP